MVWMPSRSISVGVSGRAKPPPPSSTCSGRIPTVKQPNVDARRQRCRRHIPDVVGDVMAGPGQQRAVDRPDHARPHHTDPHRVSLIHRRNCFIVSRPGLNASGPKVLPRQEAQAVVRGNLTSPPYPIRPPTPQKAPSICTNCRRRNSLPQVGRRLPHVTVLRCPVQPSRTTVPVADDSRAASSTRAVATASRASTGGAPSPATARPTAG